ncbi:hypothetical protein LOK46_10640 [Methylobacterium sp. NMS14P]|uniref:hypothetical protein n=1 Tax=Methylobacterium sp. NMS14P TaxID=2894310 RepID=UPI0023594EF0|nr:hypothetical protein [Methylobacterium sp. NMS14P]WCS27247.1 hypothetical protein LOK46_10640 [Methylobacterium sp. NMS14P]
MAQKVINQTHGHASFGATTAEYEAWRKARQRCENPKNPRYASYGGRGIQVCERWRDFAAFFADMGSRPTPAHQLDRKDNDKGYEPGNCRWATPAEQMVNRRNTRFVEVDGKQVPLATLAKEAGLPINTLRFRILKGWDLTRALTAPLANTGPKRT